MQVTDNVGNPANATLRTTVPKCAKTNTKLAPAFVGHRTFGLVWSRNLQRNLQRQFPAVAWGVNRDCVSYPASTELMDLVGHSGDRALTGMRQNLRQANCRDKGRLREG